MTKKDYQIIADSLSAVLSSTYIDEEDTRFVSLIVDELCRNLAQDNSKFNASTFKKACGLPNHN